MNRNMIAAQLRQARDDENRARSGDMERIQQQLNELHTLIRALETYTGSVGERVSVLEGAQSAKPAAEVEKRSPGRPRKVA